MEFDLQWLLIGLPVAFAFGWLASRFDLKQSRRDHRDAPRAYFKGLNLLLNEQHDKAIDAFIEAVQHDPDTTELHFALGSLFRRRGEFERAVRVHHHLLQRADLPAAERARAQHALAQDYLKAGLFDRAEDAFRALQGSSYDAEAQQALLVLYERAREWQQAIETAARVEAGGGASLAPRVAHYWCEQAQAAADRGDTAAADAALDKAVHLAPDAARAHVMRGRRHARAGAPAAALAAWDELRRRQPAAFSLIAAEYADAALQAPAAARDAARAALIEHARAAPSLDALRALARLQPQDDVGARAQLLELLERQPTLSGALELLAAGAPPLGAAETAALRSAVAAAAKPLQRYRCAACGFDAQHWFWQCPGCLGWDTFPPRRLEEEV